MMSNTERIPPPMLTPGKTPQEALAMLGGAVDAAVKLLLEENLEDTAGFGLVLIVAWRQWQDSGFMIDESKPFKAAILEAFGNDNQPKH